MIVQNGETLVKKICIARHIYFYDALHCLAYIFKKMEKAGNSHISFLHKFIRHADNTFYRKTCFK